MKFYKTLKPALYNLIALSWLYSFINIIIWSNILCLAICLILSLIVVSIDKVKYKILKERFSYEDFFLYIQVFRFPNFYIPFIGKKKFWTITILISLIILLTTFFNFISITSNFNLHEWFYRIITFILTTSIIFYITKQANGYNLNKTTAKYGLFMTILIHFFSAKSPKNLICNNLVFPKILPKRIIAIESESFFFTKDKNIPYPYEKGIYGDLRVNCYGAYTMRSEFAFLTGLINTQDLKNNYINPYRKVYKNTTNSYIQQLKKLGYYCVAIHPFNKKFFKRDKVFQHLGFDEFIDEKNFPQIDIFTPDKILNNFIKDYISKNEDKKIFIFVISIAAHGPYTLPRKDPKQYCAKNDNEEINVYLDLNFKANMMLRSLEKLANESSDNLLIWYGDHKPSINRWSSCQTKIYNSSFYISTKNKYKKTYQNIEIKDLLQFSLNNS